MPALDHRPYFFDAGLRFTCQQCGACCTGAPGIIRVSAGEIEKIAAFLKQSPREFGQAYLTDGDMSPSIGEHPDGRCLFYDAGCRIYPVRPRQCRINPFWFTILRSESNWRREAQRCAGIGKGRVYARKEILALVALDMVDRSPGRVLENLQVG